MSTFIGRRYRFSRKSSSKSGILERLIMAVRSLSANNSASIAGDRSRLSHPASAVFPQSSIRSSGISGRRPTFRAFRVFRRAPKTPHTQTRRRSVRSHPRLPQERLYPDAYSRLRALKHVHVSLGEADGRTFFPDGKTVPGMRCKPAGGLQFPRAHSKAMRSTSPEPQSPLASPPPITWKSISPEPSCRSTR